jgi:LysM repeat protein
MTTTYQIRPGDTLSAIAARNKTTVAELAKANGITNANAIKAGDALTIPDGPDAGQPGEPAAAAPAAPAPDTLHLRARTTYTVRRGDTLEAIADRHGASVRELMDLNGIRNPNRIAAGQVLKVPQRHTTEPVTPDAAPVPRARPDRPRPDADSVQLSTAPGLSARDTEALIRAVAAEARGESPATWMGVAQTIINYSRQNDQPIHRLVRTSYLSSNFDGNRRFYTMPLSRIPNLAGIREAVNGAAQGRSPIGNRIHFHDDSIATPWFGDRRTRYKIDSMVFFNPK